MIYILTMSNAWRPQFFTEKQIQKIVDDFILYVETEEDPTIVWFTSAYPPIYSEQEWRKVYINKDYINNHDEFCELRKIAIEKQENYLLKWVTKNELNPTMWVFRLKQPQHWYTDKMINDNNNTNLDVTDELTPEHKSLIASRLNG